MSLRVGVFDSGVGGLSVLRELYANIPAEYIYIGDSLRAPYGNKSREELLACTKDLLLFLKNKNVSVYVSACNSISTLDTEQLLESLGIDKQNYIDMRTFAETVKQSLPEDAKLLIYGTVATIQSGVYQEVFKKWDPRVLTSSVLGYAIETKHEIEIDEEVDALIDYVLQEKITHVLLACTHYPLIQEYLDIRFRGAGVSFVDPAEYIPAVLKIQKGDKQSLEVYTTKKSEVMNEYVSEIDDVTPAVVEL